MHPRYIVFIRRSTDAMQSRRVLALAHEMQNLNSSWQMHAISPGMTVLSVAEEGRESKLLHLPSRLGVVIGRVFTRPDPVIPCMEDDLRSPEHARLVIQSAGRFLIEQRWGQYVAFLTDSDAETHHIIRDPSGAVPCYFHESDGLLTCFSHFQDLKIINFCKPTINWRYVSGFLLDSRLQIQETGFSEITELHAGARLTHSNGRSWHKLLWTPSDVVAGASPLDFDGACNAAVTALTQCTGVMASRYRRVIHRLSGGLDSTVILALLQKASTNMTLLCENHFAPSAPDGDERVFARLVAEAYGKSVSEIAFQQDLPTLRRLEYLPLAARPSPSLFSFQHDIIPRLALEHGIDTFTNGHGGDQTFCNYSGPMLAADLVIDKGLVSELPALFHGIAANGNHSLWRIAASVIKHAYGGIRDNSTGAHHDPHTPLSGDARACVARDYTTPAWLANCERLPPGKLLHVKMVSDLQVYNEATIENTVADTPLLMGVQPLVEVCLRTPTYVLCRGGADRAVERNAFGSRLPSVVVNRHRKGATTHYFGKGLLANRNWIRSFLLDGVLANSGVIDRPRLESLLSLDAMMRLDSSSALIDCLIAEAWAAAAARHISPGMPEA